MFCPGSDGFDQAAADVRYLHSTSTSLLPVHFKKLGFRLKVLGGPLMPLDPELPLHTKWTLLLEWDYAAWPLNYQPPFLDNARQ
jgi:hypothetical protein